MIQQQPTGNSTSEYDLALRASIRSLIAEGLTLLDGWSPLSVNDATRKQYFQTSALLAREGRTLKDAPCKSTFYKWRAGEVFVRSYELDQAIANAEHGLQTQDPLPPLNARNFHCLANRIRKLRETPPLKGLNPFGGPGEWTKLQKKTKKKRAHLAKRKLLGELPNDWMGILWLAAATSKYRDVIAVLALTGCRPEEIRKGVSCHMEGDALVLAIEGAKTGQAGEYGQRQRKLTFTTNTTEAAYLAERCSQVTWGELYVKLKKARLITDIMRTWSIKLWPGRPNNRVTPYVYRQAAFARNKAQWSPEKVAQAMGQSSDRTQQRYGMRSQAGKGAVPTEIWASNPVRMHASLQTKQPKSVASQSRISVLRSGDVNGMSLGT